jgi:DNA-binding MarR family transcriptional regulator
MHLAYNIKRVYARFMDDQCICTTLRQAAAQITAHYDAVLASSGIKVTMFRLLRRIDAAKCVSITELATIVGLDRSTLGRNLRVLEKQSLIEIGTGEDGRARPVSLTQTGHEKLQEALPLWQKAQRELAEIVGADTLAVLGRVIDQNGEEEQAIGDNA